MTGQIASSSIAKTVGTASHVSPVPDRSALRQVANILDAGQRFVLTCHERPDGDALGSMLGLGLALQEVGREITLFTVDPPPPMLSFLPGIEQIVHELPDPFPTEIVLVVLDCSEPDRIGKDGRHLLERTRTTMVLDHHLTRTSFDYSASYVDPDLFATAAIVLWILEELGWPVSTAVATNLYAAILTDTGCFRHSNTTELAFAMAQTLVAKGADPSALARRLYQHYPVRRLRLLAMALHTLEVELGGKVAFIHVTPEMFRTSAANETDTEDFVCYPRSIDTVEVAILIREIHAGHVTVSLRSKTHFNVAALAKEFGGGGHFHAAGFRKAATATEIREALLAHLTKHLEDRKEVDG